MRLIGPQVRHDAAGSTSTASILSEDAAVGEFAPSLGVPRGWRLDTSIDPFVPLAAALAAWYGEDLVVESPVTEEILTATRRAAWSMASLARRAVPRVDAPIAPPRALGASRQTGVFVSRGIDSSVCLVLADRGEIEPDPTVGIVIRGIDYGDLAQLSAAGVEVAREFGLEPLVVTTNAEAELVPRVRYPNFFTSVLVGISLALRHHLSDVVIGSSSTPETTALGPNSEFDEHFSTDQVGLHHLPRSMPRSERVAQIAADGRPLRWLRVCWRDPLRNCGRCRKCLMTLAMLDACGGREAADTFDRGELYAEEFRSDPPVLEFLDDLISTVEPTRPDIANVLREAAERNVSPFSTDPEPARLHTIAARAAEVGHLAERPVRWCAIADPAHHLSGSLVDEATRQLGPGLAWSAEVHVRPVAERILGAARLTLWSGPDDRFDLERAVLALENGSRPVHVVAPGAAEVLRRQLPGELAPLVCSIDRLHDLAGEPPEALTALTSAFVEGGSGWMREPTRR